MIKCVAIDDEPLALRQMVSYIDKTPFLELVGKFHSALLFTDFLKDNVVDLLFLDINMPDINGLDFIKTLNNPPKVIFTTAYREYALDGFKVNAVDYLLKPIEYKDFLTAAQKANHVLESQTIASTEINTKDDDLFIKTGQRYIRVKFRDIKYLESMKEYVCIHLINGEPITTLLRLKNIEQVLPKGDFMRIHRSFIVNLEHIVTVERNRIIYSKTESISVSSSYADDFKAYINEKFLG